MFKKYKSSIAIGDDKATNEDSKATTEDGEATPSDDKATNEDSEATPSDIKATNEDRESAHEEDKATNIFDSNMIQRTFKKIRDRIDTLDRAYDELFNKIQGDNKKRRKKKYKVLKG